MKFVERKDLDKAKCNFCGSSGIYITRIPYPLGISRDYDSGMRIHVCLCLCKDCMKTIFKMLEVTYGKGIFF